MPLPLFCLTIRVFGNEALPTLAISARHSTSCSCISTDVKVLPTLALHHSSGPLLLLLTWLLFCALKLLISIAVLGFATLHIERTGGRRLRPPPPTHPHTHTQHRDNPSTHPASPPFPGPRAS